MSFNRQVRLGQSMLLRLDKDQRMQRLRREGVVHLRPAPTVARSTAIAVVFLGLLFRVDADAQVAISAGAAVGTACAIHNDPCHGRFVGPVAGILLDDRIGLRLRYVRVQLDDDTEVSDGVTIARTRRERELILGEVLYLFGSRNKRLRPMVGVAFGRRQDRLEVRCSPVSCAEASALLGGRLLASSGRFSHSSFGIIGGLAATPFDRVTVEALVGVQDFPREEGSTIQGAFLVSVRLWRTTSTP